MIHQRQIKFCLISFDFLLNLRYIHSRFGLHVASQFHLILHIHYTIINLQTGHHRNLLNVLGALRTHRNRTASPRASQPQIRHLQEQLLLIFLLYQLYLLKRFLTSLLHLLIDFCILVQYILPNSFHLPQLLQRLEISG